MEASTKHKIYGTLSILGGIAALAHAKDASSTSGTVAISAAGGVLTLAGLNHLHRGFMGDGGQTGTIDGLALAGLALAGEGCNCGQTGAVALSGDYGAVALSGDYGVDEDEESEAEEQFDRAKEAIERTSDAFTKIYWNWMERAKKDGERYAQKLRLDDPDYDPNAYWKEMATVVKVVAVDRLAVFLTARGVNPLGREGQEITGRLREVGERRFVSAYWAERASRLRKAGKSKYSARIRYAKDKRLANLRGWAKGTEDLVRALKQAVKD